MSVAVWVLLLLLDGAVTYLALAYSLGWELNPVLNLLVAFLGLPLAVLVKTLAGIAIGWYFRQQPLLRLLNGGLLGILAISLTSIVIGVI